MFEMQMKRLYLIIACMCAGLCSFASDGLVVADKESRNPIELASIAFLSADSAYVDGTITDERGIFRLPGRNTKAAKFIKISAVGYGNICKAISQLKGDTIFMTVDESTRLGEVTVKGIKQPFTVMSDKVVFDPGFVSYATNALDIVSVAPGIIDNGEGLVMPGKDGIKFYINGKEQKGTIKDAMMILKSYPSKNVAKVEIMTVPSPRYTLGQNVGVVNIVLKKQENDFLGGGVSYKLTQSDYTGNDATVYTTFRRDKFQTSLNLSGDISPYGFTESNRVPFDTYVRDADSWTKRSPMDFAGRWDISYKANENWDFSLTAYYSQGRMRQKSSHLYTYSETPDEPADERIVGRRKDDSKLYSGALDIDGRLSESARLTVTLDYLAKRSPTERSLMEGSAESQAYLDQKDNIRSSNLTAQTNLEIKASEKIKLDIGVNGIITKTKSDYNFYQINLPESKDRFNYTEKEINAYGRCNYTISSKMSVYGGLRYQYFHTSSESPVKADKINRHFSVVCPSLYLSYKIDNNQSLRGGYYYNIVMPTLSAVNPARLYLGKDYYRVGNPYLKRGRHYTIDLTYYYKSFQFGPYVEWYNNGIKEINYIDDDNNQVITWANAVDRRTFGFMTYWAYSKLDWLRFSITGSFANSLTKSNLPLLRPRVNSVTFTLRPNIQFIFDKESRFVGRIYGFFRTPEKTADMYIKSNWNFNASLTWKISKQWALTASGDCLLHGKTRGHQYLGDSEMSFSNEYLRRGFSLGISYNWGISTRAKSERRAVYDLNSRTKLD